MEEDDEKDRQSYLDRFLDGNPKLPSPSVQEKTRRKHLRAKAKYHLREFLLLYLDSIDGNSIDLHRVSAFVNRFMKQLEMKGVFYLKKMPRGNVRIFKKVYCCETVEDWKNCPEYRCPVWPCERGWECPYHPREHKPIEAIEVAYQEPEQKKDQPVESV